MNIEKRYSKLVAQRNVVKDTLQVNRDRLRKSKKNLLQLEQVRWLFTEAIKMTQVRFQERVESLVTMTIQSIYNRPLSFVLDFVRKGNRLQCIPLVKEHGNLYNPSDDEVGGGLIDVISFAFRVVLWSLERPQRRPIFILDEPMKFVGKAELLSRAGAMLREISHKLGFQLIVLTHEPQLIEIADKAFRVTHNGTHSTVTEMEVKPKHAKISRGPK